MWPNPQETLAKEILDGKTSIFFFYYFFYIARDFAEPFNTSEKLPEFAFLILLSKN